MGSERRTLRCAIYTRKSSEHGLEQDFNSLHAQRESAEAYIKSQAHEGWRLIRTAYDDGGLSGGTMERPALRRPRLKASCIASGSAKRRSSCSFRRCSSTTKRYSSPAISCLAASSVCAHYRRPFSTIDLDAKTHYTDARLRL